MNPLAEGPQPRDRTMKQLLLWLCAASLFAAPAWARQTSPASAIVRVSASDPAPLDSLLTLPSSPLTYVPDAKDVLVIEVESLDPTGDWVEESLLGGFGGESYFRWNGPNLFNTPGRDVLSYSFEIKTAGRYLFRLHVRSDDPDPSEENDCWARLDNDPWEKLFLNIGQSGVGAWSYNGRYESTSMFPEYDLTPGTYTYEISGRSTHFKIDRLHVLPYNTFFAQLSDPQSDVQRLRPIVGQSLGFAIDDPLNSAGLTPGTAMSALYGGPPGTGYPLGRSTNFGELFLGAVGTFRRIQGFQTWSGPGQPNVRNVMIPNNLSLVGQTFITQGLWFEPGQLVLTNALELNLGDV